MNMDLTIGEASELCGVTERTLRYYEEMGLLTPPRDGGGRRRYDNEQIERLYRIRLLRELGTPVADLDPDACDLQQLTDRHLDVLDEQLASLSRLRERVRVIQQRLHRDGAPDDQELLEVLTGLPDREATLTRRLTLLVYADIAAAQRHLVTVFGFAPGELTRDGEGTVVHGEVYAGDGVIWMHRESEDHRLVSPARLGAATHCMAVHVGDLDAHFARVRQAGADVVYEPTAMPYGVREYGVRDSEDGLWSFMEPLEPKPNRKEAR